MEDRTAEKLEKEIRDLKDEVRKLKKLDSFVQDKYEDLLKKEEAYLGEINESIERELTVIILGTVKKTINKEMVALKMLRRHLRNQVRHQVVKDIKNSIDHLIPDIKKMIKEEVRKVSLDIMNQLKRQTGKQLEKEVVEQIKVAVGSLAIGLKRRSPIRGKKRSAVSLAWVRTLESGYARSQSKNLLNVVACHGKFGDLLCGQRCFNARLIWIDGWCLGGHGHDFSAASGNQNQVNTARLIRGYRGRKRYGLESGLHGSDHVASWRHGFKMIKAGLVRSFFHIHTRVGIVEGDGHVGDDRSC